LVSFDFVLSLLSFCVWEFFCAAPNGLKGDFLILKEYSRYLTFRTKSFSPAFRIKRYSDSSMVNILSMTVSTENATLPKSTKSTQLKILGTNSTEIAK